jgi:hypothetical protein
MRFTIPLALTLLARLAANGNIVINPTFDSTITSDPNAATIEASIRSAIQSYQDVLHDPITVNITFKETTSGLAASSSYIGAISYSSFRSALAAAAPTSAKTTALAHLPTGPNNPVNNNASVTLTTANLRALGFSANTSVDGFVWLNTSIMNLSRNSTDPSKYDLISAAMHEIDEVLGFGSALDGLANGAAAPTGPAWVLDLYRYDQNGNRSLNTSSSALSYFSLDGVTRLVQFNQDSRGDFSDWFSVSAHTPRVQDAFGTPGAAPNLGVELTALDTLGYNYQPVVTPTPAQDGFVTSQTLGTLHNDFTGFAGMQIVVGSSPITVTTLGRMMASGNTGTHTVKLVRASDGTDVSGGSVSVLMSGGTAGQYQYTTLSAPVVLDAGATYYLVSQETSGGDTWYYDDTTIQTTSVASETAAAWGYGVGQWHLNGGPGQAYGPVDFKYGTNAPVPPPADTGFVTSQTLGTLHNDFTGFAGMQIVVGSSPITVAALGRMMAGGNAATHTVKLVRASDGTDVPGGTVSISMSGGTAGQYRYGTLSSPVVLAAGTTYYLMSQETSGGDSWYYDDTIVKTTSVASETAAAWGYGVGQWHLNGGAGQAYGPVDFRYVSQASQGGSYVTSQQLGTLHNTYSGYAGMQIVVGPNPITATALGRMMVSGNTGTHTVKLVKASDGSDVPGGSVSISMSGGTAGQYRYANLGSPIVLSAGATYYVMSQETSGGDSWYYDDTIITTTSVATETAGAWGYGAGQWHLNGGPGQAYGPVDFKYSGSEIPGSLEEPVLSKTSPDFGDDLRGHKNDRGEVDVISEAQSGQKRHLQDEK